jgi:hypothetical protein
MTAMTSAGTSHHLLSVRIQHAFADGMGVAKRLTRMAGVTQIQFALQARALCFPRVEILMTLETTRLDVGRVFNRLFFLFEIIVTIAADARTGSACVN